MSTFSGSGRGASGQHVADPWHYSDVKTHGAPFVEDRSNEYDLHSMSAAERLSSTRSQSGSQSRGQSGTQGLSRRLRDRLRLDLVLGLGLVLIGVVFVMSTRENSSVEQVVDLQSEPNPANSESLRADPSATDTSTLLADEALVAVSLDPGSFPPALIIGDVVQVVVTPTFDGGGEVRVLESKPVVHRIDPPGELENKWIVTLRAPAVIARAIAASGPVHLSILGGQS